MAQKLNRCSYGLDTPNATERPEFAFDRHKEQQINSTPSYVPSQRSIENLLIRCWDYDRRGDATTHAVIKKLVSPVGYDPTTL